MKRAVIVHCWAGHPDYAWYPWAKAELEKLGYTVSVPAMPNPDEPQLAAWLPVLHQAIGEPDEELLLIGHSIGTVTIMRHLETLLNTQRVGKVVFVAGYTDQIGYAELENFFPRPLDYAAIKPKSAHGFVAIQSDDDPFVSNQYGDRLAAELGARVIIKHDAGHIDEDAGYADLPELLAALN
jgi:predicted alpha/beta hydrolase family esterase